MPPIAPSIPVTAEIRAFLKLALPLASAQIAQAMTGFVDTVMMGWLGQREIAAGGLAVVIFGTFLMTGTGILASVSPLVAEAYGAQRPRRVGQVARQGLWLALLLTLPSLPLMANLEGVMAALGQDPAVIPLTDAYLDWVRWGILPALAFGVLRGLVTALSVARPVMVIVIAANLFNIGGNYVLAFGKLGLPALGLPGLALASALSHWLMVLLLLGYILGQRRQLRPYALFQSLHRLEPRMLATLLRIGLPIGVSTLLEQGLFTVMTLLMGTLGTVVLAAHQIALQTVVVVFMVPLAMSHAATIRVGQWFGQRHWPQVKQAAMVSMGLTIAFMVMAAIALLTLTQPIIGLYLDRQDPANGAVIEAATALLAVAGCGQVVDGAQRAANGVLQGLQDTRVPMLLSVGAFWGVGLPSSYWLGFQTPLAGLGIWMGTYVGLAIAAIAFIGRFRWLLRHGTTTQRE